jgi:hypothetical protein
VGEANDVASVSAGGGVAVAPIFIAVGSTDIVGTTRETYDDPVAESPYPPATLRGLETSKWVTTSPVATMIALLPSAAESHVSRHTSGVAIALGRVVAQAASQPTVVGQTYAEVTSQLSGAGLSVVVSTTVGDTVDRADCIVTRQQGRTAPAPENSSPSPVKQALLSLTCGAPVASATSAGNSLASPEGKAAAAAASQTPAPSK